MSQMKTVVKTIRKALREPDWIPSGNKIMVQLDQVESFSQGGIFIPQQVSERDQMNQTEGTVVALGPLAYKDFRGWSTEQQQWVLIQPVAVGSRIKFQRHHGWVHLEGEGEDRVEYRVMHDTDVTMILRNGAQTGDQE